jgi:flagellar motor switch protein FliM
MVLGSFSGEMRICVPYSTIAPIKDVLCNVCKERHAEDAGNWAPVIVQHLEDAEVELVAHLGDAAVTLRDLLNMKLGDVIPLSVRQVVAAEIDNVPVMDCSYGMLNGRYALRVERLMTRNGDQII